MIIIFMILSGVNIYDCFYEYYHGKEFIAVIMNFLIGSGIIFIPFFLYIIGCKTLLIDYNKKEIIIERAILKTKSVIRFEEITFLSENRDTLFAGLEFLQIITDHNEFWIYCNCIHNYSQLKQKLYSLHEAQKKFKMKNKR